PYVYPYGAAVGTGAGLRSRRPCCYAGRVIYRNPYEPAMKYAAIRHAAISDIENTSHYAERRPLLLDRRNEVNAVIRSCRLYINGPAWIDVAGVRVEGKKQMFFGLSAIGGDHCIEKERA